jgi:hypothetical protein
MTMKRFCPCTFLTVALGLVTVAAVGQPAAQKDAKLSAKELQRLWEDLAGADAAKAYRAIGAIAGDPTQSVPFLKERLKPVVAPGPGVIERLIADLDSKRPAEHEKAMKELENWRRLAVPALERALGGKPSQQARKRIETLLERAERLTLLPDELRFSRAVEALEHMRTPETNRLLEVIARGAPGALPTEEAKAALKRLAKVGAGTP